MAAGRCGSSPRAPAPRRRLLFSRSDSVTKRSATVTAKRSKRARLRARLAAALQELRLAGRGRKQHSGGRGEAGLSPSPTSAQQRHGRALVESSPPPALLLCPWPLVPSQDLVAATSKRQEMGSVRGTSIISHGLYAGGLSWHAIATSSKVVKM